MTRLGMRFWALAVVIVLMAIPAAVPAKEKVQEWEFINPAGTIAIQPIKPAPRLSTLARLRGFSLRGKRFNFFSSKISSGGRFYRGLNRL